MQLGKRTGNRKTPILRIYYFCFALALLTSALPVLSQTNRGAIRGTVFDPQGAIVPEASVTVINNTGFGQLRELQLPRYLQFGLRIFF